MAIKSNSNKTVSSINIYNRLSPIKTTDVFDTYWKFAVERQNVFFKKIQGSHFPFTSDEIISKHRFTNVYRATDRVSQYLIKNVIYKKGLSDAPEEVLFRILLFKLFNKIETWELLMNSLGEISWENYNFKHYNNILTKAKESKKTIYSAAYIMPSVAFNFEKKHSNHLKLIEYVFKNETCERLMSAKKMQDAFEIIKNLPGLGDFLAYQFLIDINYSRIINFSESEFVVPGPGAKGGISKCFSDLGGLSLVEIIKFMTDNQEKEFERLGLKFKTIWGRPLQLIDCQNIFCEVDKYSRVKHPNIKGNSDRTRIKQTYRENPTVIDLFFPPKWALNEKINLNTKLLNVQK